MKTGFISLIASVLCLAGCRTAATTTPSPSHTLTATGAIIVRQDTTSFVYKPKCMCGAVSAEQIGSGYPRGQGVVAKEFTCLKCGKKQKATISIE